MLSPSSVAPGRLVGLTARAYAPSTTHEDTMNRTFVLRLSAIAALGLALLPGSALTQQQSLKQQLVGAWTLVSNDNTLPDGTKRQLFGPNPKGILIFDA